jgi:hypothetical protein
MRRVYHKILPSLIAAISASASVSAAADAEQEIINLDQANQTVSYTRKFVSLIKIPDKNRIGYSISLKRLIMFKNNEFIDCNTNKPLDKKWALTVDLKSSVPLINKIVLACSDDQEKNITDPTAGSDPKDGDLFFEYELCLDNGQSIYLYVPTDSQTAAKRFPDVKLPSDKIPPDTKTK